MRLWVDGQCLQTASRMRGIGRYVTELLGAIAEHHPEIELSISFNAAMADPHVRERLATQGLEPPPPEQQTPGAFATYLKAEMEKWGAVIRESGIKVQ